MHSLFLELGDEIQDEEPLSSEDFHHLSRVVRAKDGELITVVCSNSARVFQGKLSFSKKSGFVTNLQLLDDSPVPSSPVSCLIFSPIKNGRTEWVLEKGTELGVSHFFLHSFSRSVQALPSSPQKNERFQRVIRSAATQCKRRTLPTLQLSSNEEELVSNLSQISSPDERKFICSLQSDAHPIQQVDPFLRPSHLLVGPEGDFTSEEYGAFQARGFEPISLSPHTLRTETAAIAAVAMISGRYVPS